MHVTLDVSTRFTAKGDPPRLVVSGAQMGIAFEFADGLTADDRVAVAKSLRNAAEMLVALCDSERHALVACARCGEFVPRDRPHFCECVGALADADGDAL